MTNRNIIFIALVAMLLGMWTAPAQPQNERPVMRWIAGLAKNLLWLSVIVEPEPPKVQSEIGEDGYVQVQHGRGW